MPFKKMLPKSLLMQHKSSFLLFPLQKQKKSPAGVCETFLYSMQDALLTFLKSFTYEEKNIFSSFRLNSDLDAQQIKYTLLTLLQLTPNFTYWDVLIFCDSKMHILICYTWQDVTGVLGSRSAKIIRISQS